MNIYIYNCSNTFNYGSMMMGENFIKYFNDKSKTDNTFYVETQDEQNIERLRYATGIEKIYPVILNSLFNANLDKYDFIRGYLGFHKRLTTKFADKIDLVVVLGGDDFTEDYGWKGPIFNAIRFNILEKKGLKVVMLGQTMGPFKTFRKPFMQMLLKKLSMIYPRDPITYDYLKKIGLKNIRIMDDLALLTLNRQEQKNKTQKYITYFPSELIYRYSKEGNRNDWVLFSLFMIDEVMKKYPDKKLVIIPHVIKPEHVDDRIISEEIYNLIKDKYGDRIVYKINEMLPYQVREYILESLFTISSRMHPVVSSIQCEIPSIAISYSTKYWGIIGERYGLNDYIIDVRYLNYHEMKKNFNETLLKIDMNYFGIQQIMKENNSIAIETITKTLEEIHYIASK